MSGSLPCSAQVGAVEVELLAQCLVGQQRRDDDAPAFRPGEDVRLVARAAGEDAELARRRRDDPRVVDLEELAVVVDRLAAGLERLEEDLERLVVALDHLGVGDPRAPGDPAVPAADAELVAAARQDVPVDDPLGQHHRVVVRQHVDERAEVDPLRPLRRRGEERDRVGRRRELREEEVLDRRVRVEPDAGRRSRSARAPRRRPAPAPSPATTGAPSRC